MLSEARLVERGFEFKESQEFSEEEVDELYDDSSSGELEELEEEVVAEPQPQTVEELQAEMKAFVDSFSKLRNSGNLR